VCCSGTVNKHGANCSNCCVLSQQVTCRSFRYDVSPNVVSKRSTRDLAAPTAAVHLLIVQFDQIKIIQPSSAAMCTCIDAFKASSNLFAL
jgi:hypothetical protein